MARTGRASRFLLWALALVAVTACGSGGGGGGGATDRPGFTDPVASPPVVDDTSITVSAEITNPSGYVTRAWIEYGTSEVLDAATQEVDYSTVGRFTITVVVANLAPRTLYHWRLVTENDGGTYATEPDRAATTLTLASGLTDAHGLAADGAGVYWTDGARVERAPIDGGPAATLAAGLDGASALCLFEGYVYWGEHGAVNRVPAGGGPVAPLALAVGDVTSLAVDSSGVYWTEEGAVRSVGLTGGAVSTLAATDADPGAIAVDASNVYWADGSGPGGYLKKVAKAGGPAVILANARPLCILARDGNVYYSTGDEVRRVGSDGGTASIFADVDAVNGMVLEDTGAYYATGALGYGWTHRFISKSDADGSHYRQQGLGFGLCLPEAVAVDGEYLYWIQDCGDTIVMMPKGW